MAAPVVVSVFVAELAVPGICVLVGAVAEEAILVVVGAGEGAGGGLTEEAVAVEVVFVVFGGGAVEGDVGETAEDV